MFGTLKYLTITGILFKNINIVHIGSLHLVIFSVS